MCHFINAVMNSEEVDHYLLVTNLTLGHNKFRFTFIPVDTSEYINLRGHIKLG